MVNEFLAQLEQFFLAFLLVMPSLAGPMPGIIMPGMNPGMLMPGMNPGMTAPGIMPGGMVPGIIIPGIPGAMVPGPKPGIMGPLMPGMAPGFMMLVAPGEGEPCGACSTRSAGTSTAVRGRVEGIRSAAETKRLL